MAVSKPVGDKKFRGVRAEKKRAATR